MNNKIVIRRSSNQCWHKRARYQYCPWPSSWSLFQKPLNHERGHQIDLHFNSLWTMKKDDRINWYTLYVELSSFYNFSSWCLNYVIKIEWRTVKMNVESLNKSRGLFPVTLTCKEHNWANPSCHVWEQCPYTLQENMVTCQQGRKSEVKLLRQPEIVNTGCKAYKKPKFKTKLHGSNWREAWKTWQINSVSIG